MALTSALGSSLAGIQNTEGRISVLASNVTNADKAGYTRKELESSYVTVSGQTIAINSTIETVNFNPFLLETLVEDSSKAVRNQTISDYLDDYIRQLGSIDGNNSISSLTNTLSASLDRLYTTPEDTSLKNKVSIDAERLATELRRTSESIQDFRLTTDQEIQRTITQINERIQLIYNINEKVTVASVSGQSTANLEDDRNTALEELSGLININYFINDNNIVQIYTGGRPILDSRPRPIEYAANTNLDKNTLYPAGFAPIDLNGFDLTPVLKTGQLGALITLRDEIFVEEQAKMDEFSAVMIRELNILSNSGSSIPPRPEIISEVQGLTAADLLGATGSLRIATTDSAGVVQNFADINLAGLATIGTFIAAVNGALGPDITASITTPDGQLSLVANNAGEGVSLNQLDSSLAPLGQSFAMRYGMNNFFDGDGADSIQVSQYLLDNGNFLSTSRLEGGVLAIGDAGVNVGDGSLSSEMSEAFSINYSYAAAGNFGAQTESIGNYIDKIISDAAYRTDNAKISRDTSVLLMEQTKTTLQNISAVNIDEELANLIDLEAKYEASATMIATIQELFDTLLNAVR